MKIENGENLEGVGGMIWNTVTLDELIEIKHGYPFKSKSFSDSGQYILLTPGNCYESGGLKLKGSKEKYYTGDIPKDYLLSRGDLLVVMTDLVNTAPILGGAFMIPEDDKFLHNQRLGLINIIDDSRIHKKFLYYVLNIKSYRGQVRGSASGATVRHTSPDRIKRCRMCIPDTIAVQGRIASILSTYDDLIENNRHRMQLLEQAARLLYKEWFVHLRFPGHQHTTITNGVPKGWERKAIGDIAPFKYGKALKKNNRDPGPYPVYGSSGVVGTHKKAMATGPAIIIGRKGNVGSVFWSESDCHPIDTAYYVETEHCTTYLYYALLNAQFINTDVAVPGLNRDFAHSRQLLIPDIKTLCTFEKHTTTIRSQIDQLTRHSNVLAQARDLLLPRLMSGDTLA